MVGRYQIDYEQKVSLVIGTTKLGQTLCFRVRYFDTIRLQFLSGYSVAVSHAVTNNLVRLRHGIQR